jgi:diguanylate cyclase (GGDEF)-like protein/PAS domain S-box-containing protein
MNNPTPVSDDKILFEQAQKLAHFGVWELYDKSKCGYWSDEVKNIVGIKNAQDVGPELLKSLVHPDDWGNVISSLMSSLQKGTTHHLKYRIRRQNDGKQRWLQCSASRHIDKKTGDKKLIGIVQDITEHISILEALERSHKDAEHYKEIANSVQDLVAYIDRNYRYIAVNRSYAKYYNLTCKQIANKKVEDIIKKDNYLIIKPLLDRALQGEFFTIIKNFHIPNTNEFAYKEGRYSPYMDKEGNIQGVVVDVRDVTESRKKESKLRLFATIIENTADGVVVTNSANQIIAVNQAFCNITKFSEEDAMGKNPSILKSDRHDKQFYSKMWESIEKHDFWSGEIYNRHKDDGVYPEWLSIKTVRNTNGEIENYIGTFSDLSILKETENKLVFLAHHDSLTGLANREMLKFRLDHAVELAKRNKQMIATLFLDLDNFKKINDNYGHDIGDLVLIEASNRFSNVLRKEDTLARFGGDEFVILLENIKNERDIITTANKLLGCFNKPFDLEKTQQFLTVSIGIGVYPDNANNYTTLLKVSDAAMYKTKELGKNNFSFYNNILGKELLKQITVENDLRIAISKEEFELYYQPQISCKDEKIIGFEALVRWNHPKLGFVKPNDFIRVAEQSRLIVPLGRWILNKACFQVAYWQKEGIFDGKIAVNISGVQMEQGNIVEDIKEAILVSNIDPNMLEIEITESVLMKNPKKWIKVFKQIKELGVHLSIDDFGTGYSSLSYLRQFPLNKLKIDKSFVDDIPSSSDANAIVNAIIALAKSLDLLLIAEGVEKKEQANYLNKKGCDFIQGYLYDKPLRYEDATKKLILIKKEL